MFDVKKELLDSHEALLDVVFERKRPLMSEAPCGPQDFPRVNIPGFRKGRAPMPKVLPVCR